MLQASRWQATIVAVMAAALVLSVSHGPAGPALAQSSVADPCPESNDTYDVACYLAPTGDAQGFLSTDGDVDMYRVEPLEFGVRLQASLSGAPFAYGLTLVDWQGNVLAQSADGAALDTILGPPGSYYVVIKGASGQFSPTSPYTLSSKLTYAGAVPQVAYSTTVSPEGRGAMSYDTSSDAYADYEIRQGQLTIRMKRGGEADEPEAAGYWLPLDHTPANFTLSLDVSQENETDAGFVILFRSPEDADDETGYRLIVNLRERELRLGAYGVGVDDGEGLARWKASDAIRTSGPNRVVIRCLGDDIRAFINGAELVHVTDSRFRDGAISFVALARATVPPAMSFSNILVTTP